MQAPYLAPDCGVLEEAYLLFHSFLSWPEPCCSASRRLLAVIQQELTAPGSTVSPWYSVCKREKNTHSQV